MSTPDTSEYTTAAGSVFLQAGQSYAVTSTAPIAIIVLPEGGSSADAQLVAITEQPGGAFEFTSTVTGQGMMLLKKEEGEAGGDRPVVRAVFNRAPGASSSGTGGSSSSSAPTPPWVAYNADRSEITAADLTGLTNGDYMFCATDLTSFSSDLPSLTRGENMFNACSALTSFSSDLPSMTSAAYMFSNCSALTSFSSDLPSLTSGNNMFNYCSSLTSFSSDLPSLTSGNNMFNYCSSLTSFSSDLSALKYGRNMFRGCSSLTSFSSDLSALTSGYYMFCVCTSLTSFSSDLSSMDDGEYMFSASSSLASFSSDLSALKYGRNMFGGCVLNKESALRILNTLPTYTSGTNQLTLGMTSFLKGDADIAAALTAASAKGWTVTAQYN